MSSLSCETFQDQWSLDSNWRVRSAESWCTLSPTFIATLCSLMTLVSPRWSNDLKDLQYKRVEHWSLAARARIMVSTHLCRDLSKVLATTCALHANTCNTLLNLLFLYQKQQDLGSLKLMTKEEWRLFLRNPLRHKLRHVTQWESCLTFIVFEYLLLKCPCFYMFSAPALPYLHQFLEENKVCIKNDWLIWFCNIGCTVKRKRCTW